MITCGNHISKQHRENWTKKKKKTTHIQKKWEKPSWCGQDPNKISRNCLRNSKKKCKSCEIVLIIISSFNKHNAITDRNWSYSPLTARSPWICFFYDIGIGFRTICPLPNTTHTLSKSTINEFINVHLDYTH